MTARLEILWQGTDLLAIAKPAGLAVIPGRGQDDSVLASIAAQLNLPCEGSADPRVRIVHRIDRYTTGILLLATSKVAQRHLSGQFKNRQVTKEYLALVAGSPREESGVIEARLAPHASIRGRMIVSKVGAEAVTFWEVAERYRHFTLIRCFPKTGKTHQIRIHLASIGLPLAVDPVYNRRPAGATAGILLSQFKHHYRPSGIERPLIDRLTLHAHRIGFTDPQGTSIAIECPPPKDFRAALQMLGKYGR